MQSLEEILCSEKRGVLSLVGAGGKTSLMFGLAHRLADRGSRVLTTTTTKIYIPTREQSHTVLVAEDSESILRQVSRHRTHHVTAAALRLDNEKLQGFTLGAIRKFQESGLFDWILVEADGAARRPLKAPAEHEPVVPPETTVLVAVTGLEVIGKPLSEDLVFRSEHAGALMELAAGEIISESSLVRLITHPSGLFKGGPPYTRRHVFLNKADSPGLCECGERIARQLQGMQQAVAEDVIVGQALDSVLIRAVYPLAGAA